MTRWRVDYIGKGGKHLGTVEAPDDRSAIAECRRGVKVSSTIGPHKATVAATNNI